MEPVTIYAVFRNADMTEGRGPMVLHKILNSAEEAHSYVMLQKGVMGIDQPKTAYIIQRNMMHKDGASYNGYEIKAMTTCTTSYVGLYDAHMKTLRKTEANAAAKKAKKDFDDAVNNLVEAGMPRQNAVRMLESLVDTLN